ncbi:MAG: hypothetical protein D6820_01835, partial [Lentisphaerae bacterium]
LNNYVQTYAPRYWVAFPTRLDLSPIVRSWHLAGMAAWSYSWPTIYFTVIAVAYLLPSEVSLSLGLAPVLYGLVTRWLITLGVNPREGGARAINHQSFFLFGAYSAAALMIIYNGRQYYRHTLRKVFGLSSQEDIPVYVVWGGRIFIAGAILFVLIAGTAGLPWLLAALYFTGLVTMFLVMGRIIAETGMFFIQTRYVVSSILIGMLGPRAIGLPNSLILFMFSTVLAIDPRETLMPFWINSAKIIENRQLPLSRSFLAGCVALLMGFAVALSMTLICQYRFGVNLQDRFGTHYTPQFAFANTMALKHKLQAQGIALEELLSQHIRFGQIHPTHGPHLISALLGLVMVLAFSFIRMRWVNFPLHPIMFLMFASYANAVFGFSFLLGWLIKTLILRFAGARIYHDLMPIFMGLVAGELMGALIPIISGWIIYLLTGNSPEAFRVFPG